MSQWYYLKQGQTVGPCSQEQLQQLLASGQLKPQDHVWRQGMAQWLPIQSVPELSRAATSIQSQKQAAPAPTPSSGTAAKPTAPRQEQTISVGTIPLASQLMQTVSKPIFFGIVGALGCLLGAILVELPYHLLTPSAAEKKAAVDPQEAKVDVMFVLDVTASMGGEIKGVRDGIGQFVSGMKKEDLDVHVGLTYYRDRIRHGIDSPPEDPQTFKFKVKDNRSTKDSPFTDDVEGFRTKVSKLEAKGGDDLPESALDALVHASRQKFRKGAIRVLLLITDAEPHIPDKEMKTLKQAERALLKNDIQQIHLVVREGEGDEQYKTLQRKMPGQVFDLDEIARGKSFGNFLPEVSKQIAEATKEMIKIRSLQSGTEHSSEAAIPLLLQSCFWTAIVALGLSLSLIAGLNLYLRRPLITPPEAGKGSGSLLAGVIGGALGQLFLMVSSGSTVAEIFGYLLGWSLLGGVIGVGMALFVPNLQWYRGILGGSIGGFVAAIGFLLVRWLFGLIFGTGFGDLLGRWVGATILGFCVGVMVALAEMAFRRWWLEVSFGPREIRTVTLGNTGVTIGSDERNATIFVRDIPAIALRYEMADDRVICQDVATGVRSEMKPGEQKTINRVTVTVRSAESGQKVEFTLRLSNGKTIPLSDGLPLTAQELPGLQAQSADGTVALISRKPSDPKILLLRNRSKQNWSTADPNGTTQAINPGLGVTLQNGVRINFGAIQGVIQSS